MTEPILRLENVSYAYPDGPIAVENLSVCVEKGERVAVLGRNGAGKSTFFLLCNGVLEPKTGSIFCAGKAVTRKKQDLLELRRRVGIVFQEAENQILAVTVEGEVSFGPLNLGLSLPEVERRTADALSAMGLEGYAQRSPQYLSGGEKKRVTIADILAMEPDVILLDEPTASLDPENVARLEEILDRLTQAGIALLVSTHDVDFATRFARRGLVFTRGRLAADASLERIFADSALLEQAGLRRPWLWQAAEAAQPGQDVYPLTMEQYRIWLDRLRQGSAGDNHVI